MAGPSWLADALAALMIVIAAYCAGRLAAARLGNRATETDADGLHVVMGVAMAGMLVPRLSLLPAGAWAAVFAAAAAWFAWQSARAARSVTPGGRPGGYPVPHLVECAAMLDMLLAVPAPQPGAQPGAPAAALTTAMPGMTGHGGAGGAFPVLAVVLALYLLGYVLWTADRLAALARARIPAPARSAAVDHIPVPVPVPVRVMSGAPGLPGAGEPRDASGASGARHQRSAERLPLAPRLAGCYKIVMGMSMGYMLIMTM